MTENTIPTGEFVSQHLRFENDHSGAFAPVGETATGRGRIQPNGVDIGIDTLYRTSGRAVFKPDDTYEKPNRLEVQQKPTPTEDGSVVYSIPSGNYVVVYDVEIEIPDGYIGHVYPRSRLMRCGMHLTTALWDQGYEGKGEGLLQVPRSLDRATIPVDMPIAQMTFRPAESNTERYDGTHQGERIRATGDD